MIIGEGFLFVGMYLLKKNSPDPKGTGPYLLKSKKLS
jgi:hypothetical protein